MIIFTKY